MTTTKELIAKLGSANAVRFSDVYITGAAIERLAELEAKLETQTGNVQKLNRDYIAMEAQVKDYREAMTYAMWQHDGHGTSMHNHWYAKFQDALAKHNKG